MTSKPLETYHKALAVNLDPAPYGTIAEIGAGQETSRWFFKVGGAAGTVAKTMSAYDMKFSDSIYGPCKRYVSRERLQAMLDKEYDLVVERLDQIRGAASAFFAFANTVTTYNYTNKSAGNGWLGIRFQPGPQQPASQIDIHVVLRGRSGSQDQKTLGILGVNLIHSAFFLYQDPLKLLISLMDNLSSDLLEIDMIDFVGPAFTDIDNRLMALYLVKYGLSRAAMFNASGKLVQPSDVLYKKSVLVERSRFRPPTTLTMNILDRAYEAFISENDIHADDVMVLSEMTLLNLCDRDGETLERDVDIEDYLHRAEILSALGKNVLISSFGEFYKLSQYLFAQTNRPVAIALGVPNLINIFEERYYQNLEGGILEAFGKLFRNNIRLYVSPMLTADKDYLSLENVPIPKHLMHLYMHLKENGYLHHLGSVEQSLLDIRSDDVLEKIRCGDPDWQNYVPPIVFDIISRQRLFQQPGS
jgi:hypothetical protein